ncbi:MULTISPECIES: hypothetical protein [Streptomyces]|uniref:Uncharacterized protein n=1 Tax=Streptomyces doebereineriae TaxID=3075528 RepID=A0ABU2VPI0_9ACTN|nr:hypothetical protein [Streptomyces sp. DSM 41640]MDT0487520.1 hypothetical protein [Streptomyces sp. DSM 41640]
MHKKYLFLGVGLALGAVMSWGGVQASAEDRPKFSVEYAHASTIGDFSQDESLVGFADFVFHGTVVTKKGTTEIDGFPETQWAVKVNEVFEGTLQVGSTTVVNQTGGYDEDTNSLTLMEGDLPLEVGENYVFATRRMSDRAWYTMVPVYGARPVGSTTQPFPDAEDMDGDGTSTVGDYWDQMVRDQVEPDIGPGADPDPTDEPSEQPSDVPTGEPEPTDPAD